MLAVGDPRMWNESDKQLYSRNINRQCIMYNIMHLHWQSLTASLTALLFQYLPLSQYYYNIGPIFSQKAQERHTTLFKLKNNDAI